MSYSNLPAGVSFTDPNQHCPVSFLELVEKNVTRRLYDDGGGNPTIGIGLNLTNPEQHGDRAKLLIAPWLFTAEVSKRQAGHRASCQHLRGHCTERKAAGRASPSDGLVDQSKQYSQTQALPKRPR